MSVIKDFWTYCSCYEIPRNYAIWSAIGLIGATTMRRVYVRQGDVKIHGNIYVCLIGQQGIKKSTAMNFAREVYEKVFPEMPCAAAMQSREDIIKFMASDEDRFFFTNHENAQVEYHPYVLFINELKNFLSFNAAGMIEFLTDIYDRPYFNASTIKRGLESFPNPCINIIACETPQWITEKLKSAILVGGMARRMVMVYENDDTIEPRPRPKVLEDAKTALLRIHDHLPKIAQLAGEFQWTPEAEVFFDDWYLKNRENMRQIDDPMMQGYLRTKDMQVLKVSMLLALGEYEPKLLLTPELLQQAIAVLDAIEPNMAKLTLAAGRNELAGPQVAALDLIERYGGCIPEKQWSNKLDKDLNPMEKSSIIRNLKDSERIYIADIKQKDGSVVTCVMSPDFYRKMRPKK